ncbi:hypothetical protein BDW74DRAFT_185182 [Aspergillus multicolor]|uniref:cytochrome P450 n=1 Tax=Aspergillus multicolor TaxID=41759 RepID=UPI003CCD96FF
MLWLVVLVLPAFYTLSCIASLLQNRSLARKTNLPYILFPVYEQNLVWIAVCQGEWFRYIVKNWLPRSLADIIFDSTYHHRWTVKERMAERYGGVYLFVTPGRINVHVGDADVVTQVCRDRQGFVKRIKNLDALAMYGPNLVTTEGNQWVYHHRYTAPAFNEKNNALVWAEAVEQARDMLDYWRRQYPEKQGSQFVVPDPREDTQNLALNVISMAGFGVKLPFKPTSNATATNAEGRLLRDADSPPAGYTFTFRDVMQYMSQSIVSVLVANGILAQHIPRWTMPFMRKQFLAHADLGKYLQAVIDKPDGGLKTHNVLQRIVMSRRVEQTVTDKRNPGLTDSEILGNAYIFMFAGHETTATTLRFALVLLALDSDIQEVLHKEVINVLEGQSDDPAKWDYDTVFPNLVLPLCVMLETLRLYPVAPTTMKATAESGADLRYNGQTHHLPPDISISLNPSVLHYLEEYWGPDVRTFNPRRWDKRNPDSFLARNDGVEGLSVPGLEHNTIHRPIRGSYIPFSDGERGCIGKKFAQVEFVAAIAVLFRNHRVRLARLGDETDEDARARVKRALEGCWAPVTLAIHEKVPLAFERRDTA